ncbi:MAG: hypothetical protein M1455_11635 [Actinobacteria bacterium]|nr:hypothetical protein [Actinomycetota bacterium]
MERATRDINRSPHMKWLYVSTAVLYVIIGLFLVYEYHARTKIPYFTDYQDHGNVPTGSDDQSVKDYYSYLQTWQFGTIKENYLFSPGQFTAFYGSLGVFLIVFYFFTYVWFAKHRVADLYPVESYNGYVTERGGRTDNFNYAVFTVVGAFVLYYGATNLIFGQIY